MRIKGLTAALATLLWLLPAGTDGRASQAGSIEALRTRLNELPHATHNSEVRADPVPGSELVRVWINANEDDTRLYTPAGGQMDADFQVSALVPPGTLPAVVSLVIETRGPVQPGPGPRALVLHAGTRVLTFTQREQPPARSGPLLFLSMRAEIPMSEFFALVTAPDVEGRVWDVPFRMLELQLELLRAWTVRVTGIAAGGP